MDCSVKTNASIRASSLSSSIPDLARGATSQSEFTHEVRAGRRPDLKSGAGGSFLDLSDKALFVVGGRKSIVNFLKSLGGSKHARQGPGICYRKEEEFCRISCGREEQRFARKTRTVLQVETGRMSGGKQRSPGEVSYLGKQISLTGQPEGQVYWGISFQELGEMAEALFADKLRELVRDDNAPLLDDRAFGRPIMKGELAIRYGIEL